MKILLTGLPGMGKTTVLKRFLELNRAPCRWVVSSEMRNEVGLRVGFSVTTSEGDSTVFAHKERIESEARIADYRVDLGVIDRVFTHALLQATHSVDAFLVFDEIGRMQMLSPAFKQVVDAVFASSASLLATIRHGDEWTWPYISRPDVVVVEVNERIRDALPGLLVTMVRALPLVAQLTADQRALCLDMARSYMKEARITQVRKLFHNALKYVLDGRVQRMEAEWHIRGDHDTRVVRVLPDGLYGYACTCDLYQGQGEYVGAPGECSHIQAVKLTCLSLS